MAGLPLTSFTGSGRPARASRACALPAILSQASVTPCRIALMPAPPGADAVEAETSAWAKLTSASASSAIRAEHAVLLGSSVDLARSGAVNGRKSPAS
ncbi:hypothetical protein P9228_07740 [Mesorhizobium sp. WSM4898]|uniref:hypothetical protein n=1 Tax=Mesorhizobium sp. WSM4898 TaxID=3038544 RepID=UPI002415228D|nr:hypothetical protein [Mesorhizobium sp. WSM4898]MDG4906332.1 hypothetical protein [Mesorhizobium sp. WSM4898]